MKKTIPLSYGLSEVPLRFPAGAISLRHTEPENITDRDGFSNRVEGYLKGLGERPGKVGIIVSDKTRLCQYPLYLPLLTGTLEKNGIAPENITLFIAYGTHPVQTEEECLDSYGDTYRNYRFVHHDSRDPQSLVYLGTTAKGTEVKIHREIPEQEMLISFGAILHHYFAGFGGGRKLFFPGMAGYEPILHNHELFLDYKNLTLTAGCESGNLDSNPLALDLEEIAGMLPPHLEIHAILNSRKEVCELHFGQTYLEFMEVCKRYNRFFRIGDEQQFQLVVASAGGYPKDINFIQTHKSIHNAASFVHDRGTLVILAECRDGVGNQKFMNLFRLGGWKAIFEKMANQYENNAGTALAMWQKSERIRIRFVTSLDEETCRLMGAEKTDIGEIQPLIDGEPGNVAVIQNASLIYQ